MIIFFRVDEYMEKLYERDKKIDYMKGITIVLMVLGHAYFPLTHFIYLFHMAVFFMTAGYCYREFNERKISNYINYIYRKVKNLYIPYLICNISFLLCYNFFLKINFYTDNILITKIKTGDIYGPRNYVDLVGFIKKLFSTLAFCTPQLLSGPTWFLRVLFMVSVAFALVDFVSINFTRKNRLIIQIIVAVVFLMIGYYLQKNSIELTAKIPVFFSVYILFLIGRLLKQYEKFVRKYLYSTHFFCGALLTLVIMDRFGTIGIGDNEYPNPIYLIIVSVAGWIVIYKFAEFLNIIYCRFKDKKLYVNRLVLYAGKNSIWILCLHLLAFKVVNFIGLKIEGLDICFLAADPCLMMDGCWWIAYGLVGVLIPLGFCWLYNNLFKKCVFKMSE